MKEEQGNRPKSSDNSLDEEMINYWGRIPDDKDLIDTARHFALWQKEQMMDEWLKDREGCFWDGVAEGKKAMKEQMMKEADLGEEIIRYQREDMDRDTTVGDVARHFYELGLKAKEENK